MSKKCSNCKFGQSYGCGFPMYDKNNKRQYRTMKYTTNSKDYTHCDRWKKHRLTKPPTPNGNKQH